MKVAANIFARIELNNGQTMPAFGYGVYKAGGQELVAAIAYALACGYRYIDTASFYKNEKEVGQAIKTGGIQRDELFIVSKIWPTQFGDPVKALDESLRVLGLDYLDGYLLHWPGLDAKRRFNAWEQLLRQCETGKIRALGVSNFLECHLTELHRNFAMWPTINQIEVHPHYQEKELRAFCADNGIAVVSWSPLGRGSGVNIPEIAGLGRDLGKTPAQIILRWQIQSGLVPIPKSVHDYRIRENAEVFDFSLNAAQMSRIEGLDLPDNAGRTGKDPMLWPPSE